MTPQKRPTGPVFYDPRRPYKYWTDKNSRHKSYRQAIQALALPHEGAPHGIVTVSFGVATMAPEREQLAEELVRRADRAMYRAKQGGRNRIEQAPEP